MNIDEIMEMVMANEDVKNLSHKEKRAARPAFFCPKIVRRQILWRVRTIVARKACEDLVVSEKFANFANEMIMEQQTPEEMALEIRRLAERLMAAGRKDLLLKAIGVPLLEELRIEAAKAKLSRLVIMKDYRFVLEDYGQTEVELQPVHKAVYLR